MNSSNNFQLLFNKLLLLLLYNGRFAGFPSGHLPPPVVEKNPQGLVEWGFTGRMCFLLPNHQSVKL